MKACMWVPDNPQPSTEITVQLLIAVMIHDQAMMVPTLWITCTDTHTAKHTLVIRSGGAINQHVDLKSRRFHPSWEYYFLIYHVCTKASRATMHGLNPVWVLSLFFIRKPNVYFVI